MKARPLSPSPRLRGEGRGEGASPRTRTLRIVERPPHPPRFARRPLPASGERWGMPHRAVLCDCPWLSRGGFAGRAIAPVGLGSPVHRLLQAAGLLVVPVEPPELAAGDLARVVGAPLGLVCRALAHVPSLRGGRPFFGTCADLALVAHLSPHRP